jgi:hypothetical protein
MFANSREQNPALAAKHKEIGISLKTTKYTIYHIILLSDSGFPYTEKPPIIRRTID